MTSFEDNQTPQYYRPDMVPTALGSHKEKAVVISTVGKGAKGDKGDKGDQGEQGPQGERGLKGDKGDKGDQGERGPQGVQGIQGIQGERGEKGDRGPQGFQGEKGDKGDKGERGATGPSMALSEQRAQVLTTVEDQDEFEIPFVEFDQSQDHLFVTINGLDLEQGVDYAIADGNITLTTGISIVGTAVNFRRLYQEISLSPSELDNYATKEYVDEHVDNALGAIENGEY